LLIETRWQAVLFLALKKLAQRDLNGELLAQILAALEELAEQSGVGGVPPFLPQLSAFVRYVIHTGDDVALQGIMQTLARGSTKQRGTVLALLDSQETDRSSLFMSASSRGHTYALALLVDYLLASAGPERAAAVLSRKARDETAASLAASHGFDECLRILLDNGAAATDEALVSACFAQSVDCVRLLLQHGADPNSIWRRSPAAATAIDDEWGADPTLETPPGAALFAVSFPGDLDIVQLLLAHGAAVPTQEALDILAPQRAADVQALFADITAVSARSLTSSSSSSSNNKTNTTNSNT
jgi:ankyrin repeat protein